MPLCLIHRPLKVHRLFNVVCPLIVGAAEKGGLLEKGLPDLTLEVLELSVMSPGDQFPKIPIVMAGSENPAIRTRTPTVS